MKFLKNLVASITGAISRFLKPAIASIKEAGGPILIEAARAAVAAAEASGGSGPEKFTQAKKAVQRALRGKGIEAIENAVQLAILAAVAELND